MISASPAKHILSKSTYMRGCQCIKSLWLHKHRPGLKDEMTEAQAAVFSTGTDVGMLARELFPGGVDASPATPFDYRESVTATRKFVEEGHAVIYEAAFQFNGVLAAIDILVKKRGKWYGYEVKSSTSVKDQFIEDAALQYYVITGAGIQLHDICLVHINNAYVRNGELEVQKLFCLSGVKEEVLKVQPALPGKIKMLKSVVSSRREPEMFTGRHCTKPYTCDFYGYCWKDVEEVESTAQPVINRAELKKFVKSLRYPLYFMDFETMMTAVPEHDGHWPYRQVPFQFSVHRQDKKDGDLHHESFLAKAGCNPCTDFVEKLVSVMGKSGSVLVYNQAFENTRLNELKNEFPGYEEAIEDIQERMVDLMVPFRKQFLSLPSMNGSYSIKAVLPALVPGMSYEGLEISNGGDASIAFYNLKNERNLAKIRQVRESLLKYCEMDTRAMAMILNRITHYIKAA